MAYKHTHTRQLSDGGTNPLDVTTIEIEADGPINREIAVPGSATNIEVDIDCVVARIKSLGIQAKDSGMTLKFNSSSVPETTMTLVAGRAVLWNHLDGTPIPFDEEMTEITSVFVTNNSATPGTLKMKFLYDSTP